MIENMFFRVLEMSITASVVAFIIMALRWLFGGKLSKTFSYAVWAIVLVRLLVPYSMASSFSIFNMIPSPEDAISGSIYSGDKSATSNLVNHQNISEANSLIDEGEGSQKLNGSEQSETGISRERDYTNGDIESKESGVPIQPGQGFISVIAFIWIAIVFVLLGFSTLVYLKTSKKLSTAVLYKDNSLVEEGCKRLQLRRKINVYTSDVIDTPVVVGLIKVRVILPASFAGQWSQEDLKHILTHELVHIKRLDYLIKPLSVFAVCIHWFNPVVWLSFILSQKDMEMSCDESVLSVNQQDIRSEYAKSLVNIAARQNVILNGGLLAFGESNIKSRIKGIMKFKKTRVWVGMIAVAVLAVLAFMLLTNGPSGGTGKGDPHPSAILIDDNDLDDLLIHRSQYIGDASNVNNLLNKLPYGDSKEGITLETESSPYGITINYRLDDVEDIQERMKNIKPTLKDNALKIFSLIENVETIKFNILSKGRHEVQFKRAEMQQYFDQELWAYSSNKKAFKEFLMDITFRILVYPEKYSPFNGNV